jgi:hypothetical protein
MVSKVNHVGRRLDLVESTKHDRFVREDYAALRPYGIKTVREGARWHLIETSPGRYSFESLGPMLDAAQEKGIQLILDIFHFGWPDYLDIFGADFVPAFESFCYALITYLKSRGISRPFLIPINEISFLSWASGDEGFIYPYATGRGPELKRQLAQAAIQASRLIRHELPQAALASAEPAIHIIGDPQLPGSDVEAEHYRTSQYEVWDMLSGRLAPELGGEAENLGILGINYYDRNQWVHNSRVSLARTDPRYRPFRQILTEIWERYRRPMFIAETGTEDDARVPWFNYVCEEVLAAQNAGIPIAGICLYPILNHLGWEDDRHCRNGLFDDPEPDGTRAVYAPLAEAILSQRQNLASQGLIKESSHDESIERPYLLFSSPVGIRSSTPTTFNEPLRPSWPGLLF